MRKILALLLAVLLLSGCATAPFETEPPESVATSVIMPITEPPTTAPPETSEPEPDWETVYTTESTALSVISYCEATRELRVQFRESGAWYAYYDFEPEMWNSFKNADSKGGFLNKSIKDNYEYRKLK